MTWYESEVDVADRLTKYSIHSHAQHHLEIHWFSIINSCMIVLLLTAFLATLLLHILRCPAGRVTGVCLRNEHAPRSAAP